MMPIPHDCVIIDLETTGFDHAGADRVVEIGMIRMRGGIPTNDVFHSYVNPDRNVPKSATKVHGLTNDFLADHPRFRDIAHDIRKFVGEEILLAHNASFDRAFLNAEMRRLGLKEYEEDRWFDTLEFVRRRFPGSPASLDALCARFNIDKSSRTKHGALLDCVLLGQICVELSGGRQQALFSEDDDAASSMSVRSRKRIIPQGDEKRKTLVLRATKEEIEKHRGIVSKLGKGSVWSRIFARIGSER